MLTMQKTHACHTHEKRLGLWDLHSSLSNQVHGHRHGLLAREQSYGLTSPYLTLAAQMFRSSMLKNARVQCNLQSASASRKWHCSKFASYLHTSFPTFSTTLVSTILACTLLCTNNSPSGQANQKPTMMPEVNASCQPTHTSCCTTMRPGLSGLSALAGSNIEPALLGHVLLHNLLLVIRHLLSLVFL